MGNTRYELPASYNDLTSGKLLYVTTAKYEGDWQSILHTHHFSELFYVKSGAGEFLVEDKRFSITKGDVVIVNPNIEHTEISVGTTPLEYVILSVEDIQFSFANEEEYTIFSCNNSKENLMFYFTALVTEMDSKKENYVPVCQKLFEVLVTSLLRHNNFRFHVTPAVKVSRECSKIKRYIDANYGEEITLESLAQLVHLNKYYVIHAFKSAYGVSPMSYLGQKRINTSKELLSGSDYSIAEVARLAGFSSQSYFSQSFLKSCGLSAGAYRKKMRKEKEAAAFT